MVTACYLTRLTDATATATVATSLLLCHLIYRKSPLSISYRSVSILDPTLVPTKPASRHPFISLPGIEGLAASEVDTWTFHK